LKSNNQTANNQSILYIVGNGIEKYCRLQGIVGGWLLLALTCYVTWGAFGRYVFRLSVPGMLEIPSYGFLVALALAAALTMKMGGHIRVTMLIDRLGKRSRSIIDIVGLFLSLIFSGFVCWACGQTGLKWFQSHIVSTDIKFPLFILMAIVVLGFLALCLQIIVIIINYGTKMVKDEVME
jgi:TRAP-type C4-dicarboxylate transport system permease small subunit